MTHLERNHIAPCLAAARSILCKVGDSEAQTEAVAMTQDYLSKGWPEGISIEIGIEAGMLVMNDFISNKVAIDNQQHVNR